MRLLVLAEYIGKFLAEKNLDLIDTLDAKEVYSDAGFRVITASTYYGSKKRFLTLSALVMEAIAY